MAQNQLLRCPADAASKSAKFGIGESSSRPLLRPTASIRCHRRPADPDADAAAGADFAAIWRTVSNFCPNTVGFLEIKSAAADPRPAKQQNQLNQLNHLRAHHLRAHHLRAHHCGTGVRHPCRRYTNTRMSSGRVQEGVRGTSHFQDRFRAAP